MFFFNKFKNKGQNKENQENIKLLLPEIPREQESAFIAKKTLSPDIKHVKESSTSNDSFQYVQLNAMPVESNNINFEFPETKEANIQESSSDEFSLEEIDKILDPLQYEPKRKQRNMQQVPNPAKNSFTTPKKLNNLKIPNNSFKYASASRKSDWLELQDDIDKDIKLINFIRDTNSKVRDITKKVNDKLGYEVISYSTSSSDTNSPELEDSEDITNDDIKFSGKYNSSVYDTKNSCLTTSYQNPRDEVSPEGFEMIERKGWLDELVFEPPMEQKCSGVTYTEIEELKASPTTESLIDEEIERCSSPCKGQRYKIGWCRPNPKLMSKDSDSSLMCGEIEGPNYDHDDTREETSSDEFWNSFST